MKSSYSSDDEEPIKKVSKSANVVEDSDCEFDAGMIYLNANNRYK
jgi:hypothetical protein